jgi:hypothetical protein
MSIVWLALACASVCACAARAPSLSSSHPADPAAPAGRLAGPPAILRAARPAPVTPGSATPAHEHEPAPKPPDRATPAHEHEPAPPKDAAEPQHDHH